MVSPKADSATEASAVKSLSGGADHTDSGSANAPATGGLPAHALAPTEFQRFVAASTGQMLPVYGAGLFDATPATFGPLDRGPAPGELIIGTDDELRIRIWGQVNFSANLRVSREGEIYIPKVGAIHVAGIPFSAIPAHLRSVMERVYRNFELSVDMGEIHSVQIYVTGLANRPGEYSVSALSTLVDAVFASGGPAPGGSMRHIILKRSGRIITDFDLYALLVHGDDAGDVVLHSGDLLYIPAAGPQVALLGSVRQAGIYELRGSESIDNLLDAAGGKTTIASGAHLSLERIEEHARRRAFELSADSVGLATRLSDGDIVRIDPIVSNFRNTVTLRGAVANPGRFRWHDGMRISELLPDRDALLKRDYWWHRTQLGLPTPELALPGGGSGSAEKPIAVESPAAQTNWNYAVIERLNKTKMSTSLIPFNLGRLVLDHDPSQDVNLEAGDVITIFSQSDIAVPIDEQTKYISLEGEFVHPGIYSIEPGDTLRSVVERAGGKTKRAYLYGAAFTRKSTRALEQQQLDEASNQLEHQILRKSVTSASALNNAAGQQVLSINQERVAKMRALQATGRIVLNLRSDRNGEYDLPDMQLEDGDRLFIPFAPETVEVFGAVFNPHAFLFRPGNRAEMYLRLAGGPDRDADRKRIFILCADGSVLSQDSAPSVFNHGFGSVKLHPGDSIIVPEKILRPSSISQALAWTQAVSQSSMTALEANALK